MPDAYEGADRRETPRRQTDTFITLTPDELEQVSKRVGHEVGRVHRRRVVAQTAGIILILVGVAGFFTARSVRASGNAHARYDCQLVRTLATSLGDFIESDATLRVQQARGNVTPKLLHDLERIIPLAQLRQMNATTIRQSLAGAEHWRAVDLPPLRRLQALDCRIR